MDARLSLLIWVKPTHHSPLVGPGAAGMAAEGAGPLGWSSARPTVTCNAHLFGISRSRTDRGV